MCEIHSLHPADFYRHLVYAFQKRWREMDDPLARLALLLDPRYKGVLAGQHQPLLQPVSLLCHAWPDTATHT